MHVIIYVRVSRKALNTDNQLDNLRTFSAPHPDWEITGGYIEP